MEQDALQHLGSPRIIALKVELAERLLVASGDEPRHEILGKPTAQEEAAEQSWTLVLLRRIQLQVIYAEIADRWPECEE